MKHREVIEKILGYHPDIPQYEGCDGYKCGNPEDICTGIVTALVPTVDVIRKAAALGCNLIIAHEPIFYMTPDFDRWKGPFPNRIYEEKKALLEEYGITVWRDHDHIHAHKPDGIFTGVLKYLGFEACYKPDRSDLPSSYLPFYYYCEIPETTVGELRDHLITSLGMNGLRYIGRPEDKVSRIAFCAHLIPGAFAADEGNGEYYADYATWLIREMEKENGVQVLIPGEIVEWDILSYIRDAISLGKTRACMNIGHFNLEELGMRYAADWLTDLVEDEVPVHYVTTGDLYQYK